jgi:branched-chain amino acid transport system substrate-binding protein
MTHGCLLTLTADYAFGQALERDAASVVLANGGKVLGSVRHPLNTQDFSSFLLQAQQSKAKIIGLANAGGDTDNAIKQGAEFGITAGGQHFAGLLVTIVDVNTLGLKAAQGLVLTESWYWDMTDANRKWTKRWQVIRPGKFPTMIQAGMYSAVLHYLKAVEALKSDADGRDGRKMHPAYLFEVKKPEESKYPGDDYKLRASVPADEAFRPMKDDQCPMVNG